MPRSCWFFCLYVILGVVWSPGHAQEVQKALQQALETSPASKSSDLKKNVLAFYKDRNFEPVWLQGSHKFNPAVDTILKIFSQADEEGLNSEDYQDALEKVMAARQDRAHFIEAELTITARILQYIDDIGGERLTPQTIDKELYLKAKQIDAVQVLKENIARDPSGNWIATLTLSHPEYQFLKRLLATYRTLQATQNYPLLPVDMKKIEKGATGPAVGILQQQLKILGYLQEPFTPATWDPPTEIALRGFQEQNQLDADGVVGPKTRAALNGYDFAQRVRQIIVTMERWRWVPETLEDRYVRINIAAFDLVAVEKGTIKLEMPVIIGRDYRQTPVFVSKIEEIRFNPSWHVPQKIAVLDKLPKIQKDPEYLTRGGYVLYDESGAVIDPHSVDWASVDRSNFGFRLRQVPGDQNALGKIRFSINSPFNVYLHSTPDKDLFKKPVRTFSSGCIRVAEPDALAYFVFNEPETWPLERIQQAMEGTQTENIPLQKPVAVYIVYYTVWKSPDGTARFARDIYGQDALIGQALDTLAQKRRLARGRL